MIFVCDPNIDLYMDLLRIKYNSGMVLKIEGCMFNIKGVPLSMQVCTVYSCGTCVNSK